MGLEAINGPGIYVDALVSTNPLPSDPKSEGQQHLTGVKNTILNTFPNVAAEVTGSAAEINAAVALAAAPPIGFLTGMLAAWSGASLPGAVAPDLGWYWADGGLYDRTTDAALFAVVGEVYGAGDGSTTFAVPDLRGRVPAGADDMGGSAAGRLTGYRQGVDGTTVGAGGGEESHTQIVGEIAAHTHAASNGVDGLGSQNGPQQRANEPPTATGSAGGNQPANVVQPTLVINWMIKR